MGLLHRVVDGLRRRVRAARLWHWPAEGSWRRTPDGFWMFLRPDGFFDPLYAYNAPDPAFRALVPRLVRPGDWALDVGGEQGWNALHLWRAVGPSGRVLTVEADPRAADVLQGNLDRNGAGNVRLIRVAAGDRAGVVKVQLNEVIGWSSLTPNANQAKSVRACLDIPMQTLDALLAAERPGAARVAFLKLDIEGAEVLALRGAKGIISTYRPPVYLEVNPASLAAAGTSPAQLAEELAPFGYRFWRVHGIYRAFGRTRVWFVPVPRLADVTEEMDVIGIPPALHAEWAPRLDAARSFASPLQP